MRQGRTRLREIVPTDQSRQALAPPGHSRALPQGVVRHAANAPPSAAGESNTAIAEGLGSSVPVVGH